MKKRTTNFKLNTATVLAMLVLFIAIGEAKAALILLVVLAIAWPIDASFPENPAERYFDRSTAALCIGLIVAWLVVGG